jgi:2',3'-cyclic-nucleotide 2'-phosphodiesterase (5'-nucleotidase family)
MTAPPEYPYPSTTSTQVPDHTDQALLADLRRQVGQQMADPVGSRAMVAEVGVDVGNLVDDAAAQAAIGAAADALHRQAHGE